MCVNACPGIARKFGDLNDPTSEVSRLIATRQYKQLLPEEGTNPSVYYLV
jgi:molybdopterin-containing oxidoreductase family iron-sulfur binding subunit